MRILFLTSSMGYGGAERVLSIISSELANRGHEVSIFLNGTSKECVYELDEKVQVECLPENAGRLSRLLYIKRFIKKYDPTVVVPFLVHQCFYGVLACVGTKYPVIVCERNDPNIISGKYRPFFQSKLRDLIFSLADGAVFQTDNAKRFFSKAIQEKGCVILNPLKTDKLPETFCGTREKCIVNVGRLTEQKNQKLLIRSFSLISEQFPEYVLKIYGEGPERNDLELLIKELGLENRVSLMGNVSDVTNRINKSSLFVFSSDYEGLPNALAEAMAIGLPCISTDCSPGGARMLIDDGVNGVVVPVNDAVALSKAMKELLENKEKRDMYSRNAYCIREKLFVPLIATQWEEYFKKFEQ